MNSLSPKIKNYIIAGVALAIALVLYFGVLDQYSKFNTQKQVLAQHTKELEENNVAKSKLSQYLNQYEKLKSESAKINRALPLKSEDMPQLLNIMESLMNDAGLIVGELSFDDVAESLTVQKEHSLRYKTVNIVASGSFSGLESFVINAENNLRLIDVLKIDISNEEEGNILMFEIKLRVYYQK
jgi:Tfp pilus assembly protein PilO